MSKFWVDNLKAHLELTRQSCSRLPAGERLESQDLNEILALMDECKALFLFQCELQGFKLERKEKEK